MRAAVLRVVRFLLFHDLTIDKDRVIIHVHSDRTSPNPSNSPDPDLTQTGAKTRWIYEDLTGTNTDLPYVFHVPLWRF